MKKGVVAVLVAVLLTAGLLVGCGGVLKGSGNLKTESYTFRDFTSVEISSAFEFDISQSSSYSVSITADDNVFEKVEVTKEGNTLKIGLKTIPSLGPVTLEAEITMPKLHGLAVSGASRGTVSDFSSTENLDLNVSGASKVTGNIPFIRYVLYYLAFTFERNAHHLVGPAIALSYSLPNDIPDIGDTWHSL